MGNKQGRIKDEKKSKKSNKISFLQLAHHYVDASTPDQKAKIRSESDRLLGNLIAKINPTAREASKDIEQSSDSDLKLVHPNITSTNNSSAALLANNRQSKRIDDQQDTKHEDYSKQLRDFLSIIDSRLWRENKNLGDKLKTLFPDKNSINYALKLCRHYREINTLLFDEFKLNISDITLYTDDILKAYRACDCNLNDLLYAYTNLKQIFTGDDIDETKALITAKAKSVFISVQKIIEQKTASDITISHLLDADNFRFVLLKLRELGLADLAELYKNMVIQFDQQTFNPDNLNLTIEFNHNNTLSESEHVLTNRQHAQQLDKYIRRCFRLLTYKHIDEKTKSEIDAELTKIRPRYFNTPQALHDFYTKMTKSQKLRASIIMRCKAARAYIIERENLAETVEHAFARGSGTDDNKSSSDLSNPSNRGSVQQRHTPGYDCTFELSEDDITKINELYESHDDMDEVLRLYVLQHKDLFPFKACYERAIQYYSFLNTYISRLLTNKTFVHTAYVVQQMEKYMAFSKKMFANNTKPLSDINYLTCTELSARFKEVVNLANINLNKLKSKIEYAKNVSASLKHSGLLLH